MPTEKVDVNSWLFRDKLESILRKNIKEIPYEGTEVDRQAIIDDICELLSSKEYSLLKHTKPQS